MLPNRIQRLNSVVAERIAAGEVIERPASVVKELVENSLDAGATEVAVILSDGGKALIEIIDNGRGIHRDDLALSIERHATSKLKTLEDLESLHTLGFRGEALASVAAVSDLSIISRTQDETAYEFRAATAKTEAVTFGHFLGSSHGTRIRAEGLFSQIPARLKFLKSQASEVAQVREWIERLALTHPHVSFRLVSDDRTVLNLRPQTEEDRVRAILADGEDFPLLSNSVESGSARVRVHWLQGLSSPQTRKLVQIVNGRAVRDRLLQQALLSPFRQALLPGRFPAVALFIDIDPSQLDVNVHPTKTEIRFLDSRRIFHAVDSAIERMIATHGAPAFASGAPTSFARPEAPAQTGNFFETPKPWGASEAPASQSQGWNFLAPPTSAPPLEGAPLQAPSPQVVHPFSPDRYVGILFSTYLLYDFGTELGLIDQHAAHERVRYEALRKKISEGKRPAPQALLIPEVVHFAIEARPTLEPRLAWLERMGFETELFGEDKLLFRSIPSEWGTTELRTRLKNLVDRTLAVEDSNDASLPQDETLFESLASEACHSAIRAGDRLLPEEAKALVEQLFSAEHPWNCPHGRPTVVRIPRGRFEEWFQRRV